MLLTALAAVDAADPAASQRKAKFLAGYDPSTSTRSKASASACCARPPAITPMSIARSTRRVDVIKSLGAELVDIKIPAYDAWNDPELEVLLYEFKDGINQYLKASGSPHSSLEAVIAFNKAHADKVMPHFGQELFERAQAKGPLTEPAYLKAREDAMRQQAARGCSPRSTATS